MMDLEALEAQIQADPDMMFASGYVLELALALKQAIRERDARPAISRADNDCVIYLVAAKTDCERDQAARRRVSSVLANHIYHRP